MNELKIFENSDFGAIRTTEVNGQVLFFGSDIAKALGYSNPNKAINDHCRAITKCATPISGKMQEVNFIPEGDIYRLIVNSQLPNAEKFEKWVFDEVLPSIRKHGAYMTPDTLDKMISSPEFGIKLLTALKDEQEKSKALQVQNSELSVQNAIMAPKASYFDQLCERALLTNFRDTAKAFKIKEKDFISFLITKKYVYRDQSGRIRPYAEKNTGLFEIKECYNNRTDWVGAQTLITPRGRETFRLLLNA